MPALEGECQRIEHHQAGHKLDQRGGPQVDLGIKAALVERADDNTREREQHGYETGVADGMRIEFVPYHQHHTDQTDGDAGPLAQQQTLVHPERGDAGGDQGLAGKNQGRGTRRHAKVLGVVTAAQIGCVYQQALPPRYAATGSDGAAS